MLSNSCLYLYEPLEHSYSRLSVTVLTCLSLQRASKVIFIVHCSLCALSCSECDTKAKQ